jgi:hypothetical protein
MPTPGDNSKLLSASRLPIIRTFFSAEFLGKQIFQNFFRGKFNFFPTFFWGNFLRGIFPGKMYEKIGPRLPIKIASRV